MKPLVLILILANFRLAAQTPIIEGLKKQLATAKNAQEERAALEALCDQRFSLSPTAIEQYTNGLVSILQQSTSPKDSAKADYYLAAYLSRHNLLDSCRRLIQKHREEIDHWSNEPSWRIRFCLIEAILDIRSNRFTNALVIAHKGLEIAEQSHDTLNQIQALNTIGWAYMEMNQYRDAINWFLKALTVSPNQLWFERYSLVHSNLAATYNSIGKNDSAQYYISRALYFNRRQQNLQAEANSLAIQSDIFTDNKQLQLAEASLKKAIEIRQQIGDPYYIVSDMVQLGLFYAHNHEPEKGIVVCKQALKEAQQYHLTAKLPIIYEALAENYKLKKDYEAYAATLQQLMNLKDSVYLKNKAETLAEMQTKYDVQQKENIIMHQHLQLVQRNYLLAGVTVLMLFAGLIAYLLFKNYRRKQQMKFELMQLQEQQTAQLAVVQAEEAERKRIAADLHDTLGAYAASIMNNVDQLQTSTENQQPILHQLRQNTQAIVTQLSDTIWALKKDTQSLTAISDRIKVFVQSLLPNYPGITIDVIEEINYDFLLPPAQAYNLFQIVKEAVINALRHSGCTKITVHLAAKDNWMIRIIDDGCGFISDLALLSGKGYGLNNMKQRSTESGWKITWQKADKGTVVQIMPDTN
jgi:signal transduction histidine kinase